MTEAENCVRTFLLVRRRKAIWKEARAGGRGLRRKGERNLKVGLKLDLLFLEREQGPYSYVAYMYIYGTWNYPHYTWHCWLTWFTETITCLTPKHQSIKGSNLDIEFVVRGRDVCGRLLRHVQISRCVCLCSHKHVLLRTHVDAWHQVFTSLHVRSGISRYFLC